MDSHPQYYNTLTRQLLLAPINTAFPCSWVRRINMWFPSNSVISVLSFIRDRKWEDTEQELCDEGEGNRRNSTVPNNQRHGTKWWGRFSLRAPEKKQPLVPYIIPFCLQNFEENIIWSHCVHFFWGPLRTQQAFLLILCLVPPLHRQYSLRE